MAKKGGGRSAGVGVQTESSITAAVSWAPPLAPQQQNEPWFLYMRNYASSHKNAHSIKSYLGKQISSKSICINGFALKNNSTH